MPVPEKKAVGHRRYSHGGRKDQNTLYQFGFSQGNSELFTLQNRDCGKKLALEENHRVIKGVISPANKFLHSLLRV